MEILLSTFKKRSDFDLIMNDFHDAVSASGVVNHYLLGTTKSILLKNMWKYTSYLVPKSDYEYSQMPTPSSKHEIQLPSNQYMEVTILLETALYKYKIKSEDIVRLRHEILEIVEETRDQCNETEISSLDAVEVNNKKISELLKRKNINSDDMPSGALKTGRGLPHPLWIDVNQDEKNIYISSKIFIKDSASNTDIDELMEKIEARKRFLDLKLIDDNGPTHLFDSHVFSIGDGIPIRLFIRYLRKFSNEFDLIYVNDSGNILKTATF